MKYVPRNEYFELIGKLGVKKVESEYEIADLDLSSYSLNEDTKRIANVNFMEETEDRNGNYMLGGHWMSDLSYQFAKKCKFDLVQVDGYSSYAYLMNRLKNLKTQLWQDIKMGNTKAEML